MGRWGLKDWLSPSSINTWEGCQIKWRIFNAEGAVAPFDAVLKMKTLNHKVILEDDMGYRILTGHNRANSELAEIYRADMEEAVPIFREDPNLEGPVEKFVETEVSYFDEVLKATEPFRKETKPLEVEHEVNFDFGGVPIVSRLDLIADDKGKKIVDLKRVGQSPQKGSAAVSRQLLTYAAGTGINRVGLAAVVENKKPTMKLDPDPKDPTTGTGEVTAKDIERVKVQYQAVAFEIDNAMKSGIFKPVDTGDPRKKWQCTAAFCGAWRVGSKDIKTGKDISCPWGERAAVSVSLSK